jgi:3-deoxy-D-manno-octulosonate 8-phosphate phosphatase (KDO 8-P phosphatase)
VAKAKSKSALQKKMKRVRLLALDVDGILTDCRIFMDASGEWRRQFSIRDGYGIQRLKEAGFKVAIITGSKARDIQERARHLNIDFFYEGHLEKMSCLKELSEISGVPYQQIAYMGDDDFDLPVLKAVGLSATVPDAMPEIKKISDYVTTRPAGNGAVREVCEMLIKNKGDWK